MNGIPRISVIIPVYNVNKYLETCLFSAVNQTLTDIEIICIDDYSTDGSRETIKKYALQDNRIVPIFHETNLSTNVSRRDGVLASRGEYVMFLDGDDELLPHACEKAYRAIKESGADIVQFGTKIKAYNFPRETVRAVERLLNPCRRELEITDIILEIWQNHKISVNLWNKIFAGNIVRNAFSEIFDAYLIKAEDMYELFVVAYNSTSFEVITDKLYLYRFGVGITGNNRLTIEQFKSSLAASDAYKAIIDFVDRKRCRGNYSEVINSIYNGILNDCISDCFRCDLSSCWDEAIELLTGAFGTDVIKPLAERQRTLINSNNYKLARILSAPIRLFY